MATSRYESPRPRAGRSAETTVLIVCLSLGLIFAGVEVSRIGDVLFGKIAHAVTMAGAEGGTDAESRRPSVR